MGANLAKEAANRTNDKAGDGTTTATLLLQRIFELGARQVTAGANPMIMKRGMEKAVKLVLEEIKKMSKPVPADDFEKIKQVATVSSADEYIGEKIAEAVMKIGRSGVVSVEEGANRNEVKVEYTEGMEFDRGWYSRHFVVNQQKGETQLEKPLIFITDRKISDISDIAPFLEKTVLKKKNLIFICDDIGPNVQATFIINWLNGKFFALPIRCPEFGDDRKEVLEDIAILTGATVFNDVSSKEWKDLTMDECGKAEFVWCDKEKTRIVNGKGDPEKIKARIEALEEQVKDEKLDKDTKEKLETRIAKLKAGVAVIRVGAISETELKERRERVIDAVNATRAALEEGIIVGGGVALLRARKVIKPLLDSDIMEERVGAQIIYDVLAEPLAMIANNSGKEGAVVVHQVESNVDPDYGFDSLRLEFGNLITKGVVDPTKVTRLAFENAASLAIMALTTEAIITDKEEEKSQQSMSPGMQVPLQM